MKSNPKSRAASGGGDGGRGNHGNKRRAQISIMEKVRIIERFRSGESASSIATSCGIGQSTVCEITQAEVEIMETLRVRGPVYCETHYQVSWPYYGRLEHPLRQWLTSLPPEQLPVDPAVIQNEAGRIADELGLNGFVPSKSWMNRFHKKNWKYCGNRSRGQETSTTTRGRRNSKKNDESAVQTQRTYRSVAPSDIPHLPKPNGTGETLPDDQHNHHQSQIYRSGNPDVPEVSSQIQEVFDRRDHRSQETHDDVYTVSDEHYSSVREEDGSHSRLKTGTKTERRASGTQRWASESLGHRPMRVRDGILESTGKDAGGIKTQEKRRRRRRKRWGAKSLEQIAKEILGVNGKLT